MSMNIKLWAMIIIVIVVLVGGYFALHNSGPQDGTSVESNASSTVPVASTSPAPTMQASPVASGGTTAKTYSLADVAIHKDAASCWSAINGKVYDLTSWINQHPGGPQRILSICGKDGSAAFNGQHGTQAKPNDTLATFYISALAK